MRFFFYFLALLSIHQVNGACPIASTEKVVPTTPTTTPTTTVTSTTTTPTTTTTPKPTTKPRDTATVDVCSDSGYQPENCYEECDCPTVVFNSSIVYSKYLDWAISEGNRTYLYPKMGQWLKCQPGPLNRITCPEGSHPQTVFFDKNGNMVAEYDRFVLQEEYNITCNTAIGEFYLASPMAPNATLGYFTCWM